MPSASRRRGQQSGMDQLLRGRVHRDAIVTYLTDTTDSRLPQRLAEQSTFPNPGGYRDGNDCGSPRSNTGTSMLVSGSEHTTSHDLAALTTSSSLAASDSAPSSFGARQPEISNPRLLAEGDGGVLVVDCTRADGNFECPFNFLFCPLTFSKMEDWVKHSMTHFGRIGPPDSNQCCFCEAHFESSSGISGWAKRMEHVAYHHQLGFRLAYARPDFELYSYLWRNRLIDYAVYRDLKGNNNDRERAEKAYTDAYSNSRGRRERERRDRAPPRGYSDHPSTICA